MHVLLGELTDVDEVRRGCKQSNGKDLGGKRMGRRGRRRLSLGKG